MKKAVVELTRNELDELERLFVKKIEYIVFNTRRNKKKIKGGHKIEDNTGNLRRIIKGAKNFIKQDERGLKIDFPVAEYFKYLDDERREELNWFLSEAIFEDKEIRDKIKELYVMTGQRAILRMINDLQ